MTEFLVFYEEPRFVTTAERLSFYEQEGHALVVQADNAVQAFVAAFDCLTRRGHMVRTIKAGESLESLQRVQSERRAYDDGVHVAVIAGLNLDQMLEVYEAGVPVVGGRNDNRVMTSILRIQPYTVNQQANIVDG